MGDNYRKYLGNISVPFIALLITGTFALSSITGFTQFLTVKNKIDASLIEAEKAGLVYISDNLSDSSLLQNPDQAQIILNDARTIAIARAVASLGEPTRLMLIDRNGPELTRLYQNENTLFEISSGGDKINIQLSISANVLGAVPFRYNKRSPLREVKPSDIDNIITTPSIECNATNNCGECGICDQSIGECIPNLLVPSKEPADNPDAQGKFACKDFEDTTSGEFCTDDAGGVIFTASNGEEGCEDIGCTGPDCKNASKPDDDDDSEEGGGDPPGMQCKYVDNFFAWNIVNDTSISVYWNGAIISTNGISASTSSFTDPKGHTYTRSTLFPFGTNKDNPDGDTYAVCKDDNSYQNIFVTSSQYSGNLVGEANHLRHIGGIPNSVSSFGPHDGLKAADAICTYHACKNEDLSCNFNGHWKAILSSTSGHYGIINARDRLPLKDVKLKMLNGFVINPNEDLWEVEQLSEPIKYDENGDQIQGNKFVWTGSTPDGYLRTIGASPPYTIFPLEASVRFSSCYEWSSDGSANGTAGMAPPGVNFYGHGYLGKSNLRSSEWITGGPNASCANRYRLYCVGRGN